MAYPGPPPLPPGVLRLPEQYCGEDSEETLDTEGSPYDGKRLSPVTKKPISLDSAPRKSTRLSPVTKKPISLDSAPRKSTRPLAADVQAIVGNLPKEGSLLLQRAPHVPTTALMGGCLRNYITGDIQLAEVGDAPDFHVVDLFAREELYGSLKDLAEDPYLFWPVPLRYRTWIYHDMYRNRRFATGKATRGASGSRSQKAASLDEIGTLRDVMGQFCIDVVWGFQPAAVRWYAPLALVCPLTADRSLTYFAVFVLLFCYAAAKFMNQMSLYEMTRIVSLPLRLVFMVAVCVRMDSRSFVYMFGSMFVLILCVMDVFFGDLKQLAAYRLHCSYEVIRTFPNRVCLFRRKGANFANMEYPVRVHEDVTGMGAWEPGFVLIADIYGILFELRPMTAENWRALHDARNEETPVFVGLDLYWEEEPVCPPLENIGGPATSWLPPQVREGPRPPQGPQHTLQETDL